MALIKHCYKDAQTYPGTTFTCGFEFLSKEGKSILNVGHFDGTYSKQFKVADDECVIGIKAKTMGDSARSNHGSLYNLQFKIAKLL